MVTLYKEGKTCEADPAQISDMEKGGWSKENPEKPAEETAPAKAESQPAQSPKGKGNSPATVSGK